MQQFAHQMASYVPISDTAADTMRDIARSPHITHVIAFNYEHAWTLVRNKRAWTIIDSKLDDKITTYTFPDNCGFVYLHK